MCYSVRFVAHRSTGCCICVILNLLSVLYLIMMDASDIDVIITMRILMNGKEIGGIIGKVRIGKLCFPEN